VFAAGATDKALKYLTDYSNRRLLGDHVPYAVEAWPEGNQRHLSAESALYCRVITEGIFGFRPTGLNSFSLTPQLPSAWNEMSLENITAFGGKILSIYVKRDEKNIEVTISVNGKPYKNIVTENGRILEVKL
jgi:cellobiose phosphorylase